MAKINTKPQVKRFTHEGAPAKNINAEQELRRSVMACMLWENSFYESGVDIAQRIKELVHQCKPEFVANLAIDARGKMKLRHVPLLLLRELARHKDISKIRLSSNIEQVIQRADELTEFLAIYWKDGKEKISNQVKRGLARAFRKFSAYDLAKYNRDGAVKLRDVLFLVHPKPKDQEQQDIWNKLVAGTLEAPDTWEVALSAGNDKKETWERLLKENRLGGLALLRNLRNMDEVKVDPALVKQSISNMKVDRILPFRFISAARYAPKLEPVLEVAMLKCLDSQEKMKGKTVLLIDVSGSMEDKLSAKSDITRLDAGCGLAMLLREVCEDVVVYTFSYTPICVPARRGFALRDAVVGSQPHAGTNLGSSLALIEAAEKYDRIIVITDEQSHDRVPNPKAKGYMVNVGTYQNGVGYGAWTNISGFSESIVEYIKAVENEQI